VDPDSDPDPQHCSKLKDAVDPTEMKMVLTAVLLVKSSWLVAKRRRARK